MAHQAGAYSYFCSMKRIGVLLFPLDRMLIHGRVNAPDLPVPIIHLDRERQFKSGVLTKYTIFWLMEICKCQGFLVNFSADSVYHNLRKQPSFFAPSPSQWRFAPGAKKDGCFRRLSVS